MLGETCPDCDVPLMRSPDKLVEKCVVCEKNFKHPNEVAEQPNKQDQIATVSGQIDSSQKSK